VWIDCGPLDAVPIAWHQFSLVSQYPWVDQLVSAGVAYDDLTAGFWLFQYPRVDRLVSAGTNPAPHHAPAQSCFSILGWIDWCLLARIVYVSIGQSSCFSILGWIDWCLLVCAAVARSSTSLSFSILGWIDWCLLALASDGRLSLTDGCISENSWFYAAIGREVHLDGPTGRVEPDNVIGGV
jgi:hypothetical protein